MNDLPCNFKGPCMGCTRRWVKDGKSCHSSCPEYLEAVEASQKRKDTIYKNKQADCEFLGYNNCGVLRDRYLKDRLSRSKRGRQNRL